MGMARQRWAPHIEAILRQRFRPLSHTEVIIGHMGEMLPFMLERCYDMSTRRGGGWGPHERPLRQVWDENI